MLEIAGGTGIWTVELARHADRLTVVDSGSETLAIARGKVVGAPIPIEWVVADVFDWVPPRRYDVVFFAFWLSHVPLARFEEFWSFVDRALEARGRVMFIDSAHPSLARERFDLGWQGPRVQGVEGWTDLETGLSTRQLPDGREFEIVKVMWEAQPLRVRLGELGWTADVATTDWAFLHGVGTRSRI